MHQTAGNAIKVEILLRVLNFMERRAVASQFFFAWLVLVSTDLKNRRGEGLPKDILSTGSVQGYLKHIFNILGATLSLPLVFSCH
jgi:hypothetical protein